MTEPRHGAAGDPPAYVVHHVDERDVTVDWFFGDAPLGTKLRQGLLVLVAWFFAVLPVVITASAITHRDEPNRGWWGYHEGLLMWDRTIAFLGLLTAVFIVGFLVLHLLERRAERRQARETTYDEERLARRMQVAADWYTEKFGPQALRLEQRVVRVEPYGDIETYELRARFRAEGVD